MYDYAFAPGDGIGGRDRYDDAARLMFQLRPRTVLLFERKLKTLQSLIKRLDKEKPIEDIVIASHGNRHGMLSLPMYPGQGKNNRTTYWTLQETLADPQKSIRIPAALFDRGPSEPIVNFLHIKGCNIGKNEPFLRKFRAALKDEVFVTAPKHFHGLLPLQNHGVVEFMDYEFFLRRTTPFKDRAEAIQTFKNAKFKFTDGKLVPDQCWNLWIPRKIVKTSKTITNQKLKQKIGKLTTVPIRQFFRVSKVKFTHSILFPTRKDVPKDRELRLEALEDNIRDNPYFSETQEYPAYKLYGFPTLNDFYDGYTWTFKQNGRVLQCVGRYYEYTMLVPITNTTDNTLVANFYPGVRAKTPAFSQLSTNDTAFFLTV